MKVQGEAMRRTRVIPGRPTHFSRERVRRMELRRIHLVAIGAVSVCMLGSAPIPAHAFGERVRHAAAAAPHPVRDRSQKAKRDILAYVNDPKCGKSGVINGAERFFANQKENLATAKKVGSDLKRAAPPLADAASKAAQGAVAAAELAKKYPSAVAPAVGAIRNYLQAIKTERRDELRLISMGHKELANPVAEDIAGIYFCAHGLLEPPKVGAEAAAAPETGGGSLSLAIKQIPEGAVEIVAGCYFTREHITEIPKVIASAKEFLELLKQTEEEHRNSRAQLAVAENAIAAAKRKVPPEGRGQLDNLRATIEAAARDADRSHAIVQSAVTPQLRDALQRTTLHLRSSANTVLMCTRKLDAMGKQVKRDIAGL